MTKQELQEHRDTIIGEYKTSGLAQSVFFRERGMNPRQLGRWLRKEAMKDMLPSEAMWIPVEVSKQSKQLSVP